MKVLPYGKILIVDDDANSSESLKRFLQLKNYRVDYRESAAKGFCSIMANHYDLVLVDLELPFENGLSLVQKVRIKELEIPIITLSEKYSLEHEVESYRLGANIFHQKPIEYRLLEVQIRSLLNKKVHDILQIKNLKINLDTKQVFKDDYEIYLTKLEFDLLVLFLKSNGKLYTREEILNRVFYNNQDLTNGAVDTSISRLRKKLKNLEEDDFIQTVFKSGYRVNTFYLDS